MKEAIMNKKKELVLEMPEKIEKSGVYKIKRIIDGVEDSLSLFLWSGKELEEARKKADIKRKASLNL